ncbi:hypothetical protein JF544_17170 [Halobacillus kuroshimensis]|uniref:Uncharacterized protein n=1 Tax=Halobacillus kuroshimensis TaxID=302481 RepID=A0ABS3E0N3_9BACI|nr:MULTISPECIES: hypothetical protein [Halobacillus]MBN8236994.1 hypothetical protein [Halobacillus kuroshimensis]
MVHFERKRNTFWNWKYAVLLLLLPLGFYLVSLKEDIGEIQHMIFVAVIVWLAIAGVFGLTNRWDRLHAYGYLYLFSSLLFSFLGLAFIW